EQEERRGRWLSTGWIAYTPRPISTHMPNSERIIVGIDVGTHKICSIVAEAANGPGNRLNVLGVGAVASEGVAKGMITDLGKASAAISHSLEAAERQSGCRILSAYVSMSGNHISSMNTRGLVAVAHEDRIIGQDDVVRAVEAARVMAMPAGREILHVVPRGYTVDGQEGIRNPVGLSGFRLDVETHVVTCASNVRENLIRCVQQADVEVDDLVLSPLASAEAVLTEQEKNLGVVLVDIGHGTTDVSIYVDGSVWHTKVLPVGGWHLTNDLVIVFNIPYEAAEALKLQYGRAVVPGTSQFIPQPQAHTVNGKANSPVRQNAAGASAANGSNGLSGDGRGTVVAFTEREEVRPALEDEMLETTTFEGSPRQIPRSELNEVMAARFEQLFSMVGDEIRRSEYEGLLPAGVVLTGGVSRMPGIDTLASHRLKMPVRIGRPQRIGGLADVFESPAYAASVGLVLWGMKQSGPASPSPLLPRARRGSTSDLGQAGTLAKWLKGFLPHG
ncbi:MAG TPA: cell division protein FtsA, partial [Chloroflexia bacterium]|nr:cell division protein FtsA [Chloroflexia bacterium]